MTEAIKFFILAVKSEVGCVHEERTELGHFQYD